MPSKHKIPDDEVLKTPIQECGEKLTNIKGICRDIIINNTHPASRVKEETQYLRRTVAEKVCHAQHELKRFNPDYSLMISQAFRSLDTQKRCYEYYYERFKEQNPSLYENEIKAKTDTFVAPPDKKPPHTTGGAVDITIVDVSSGQQKELDMGTELQSSSEESVTLAENISAQQKQNRDILIRIMEGQGFVNYPVEWWHWSYGDQYWTAENNNSFAVYDVL